MAGYVFDKVLTQERDGKYLGKTIQIIPHITSEIQHNILEAGKNFDIHIVEIGGTVGDYEGLHFMEAIRQMKRIAGPENVLYGHVPFLPYLETSCEVKTKPAQNSVRDLKELGIAPDVIFPRSDYEITKPLIEKLSLYCDVPQQAIIPMVTAKSIYEVPLTIEKYKGTDFILNKLGLKLGKKDLKIWQKLNDKIHKKKKSVKVGMVAKYLQNKDTYLSVTESLKAAAWNNDVDVEIIWIDAEKVEGKNGETLLKEVDGILVPGGFGSRGIEGKIKAAKFARENNIPYLGLCLGMQIASIEFARNVCNFKDANSTEFNEKTKNPVIYIMENQKSIKRKGGTMRLGAYPCFISSGTKVFDIYRKDKFTKKSKNGILVSERHRHRYEFNMKYKKQMEDNGFLISGTSPNGELAEMIEIKDHKFFVATQAHPELKSRPTRPHPLFNYFLRAIVKHR
jgi:CTP synthase